MTKRIEERKKKVLVVEDEDHVSKYLRTLLEDDGYVTFSAPDGQRGLEVARRERPDLVVLDLVMPGKTGTDFYRNLRKDAALGRIPIIVVSAVAGRNLAITRPAAVFDKPIDPNAFLAAVEQALAGGPG